MFIDCRSLEDKRTFDADICIIGAGAAGMSIALEFANKPFNVILLESGGLEPDPDTQSLYEADNIGINYRDLDKARARYFGGSTACWGGWCRPLDPIDFEQRPWIPNSGWPIARGEMDPWYERSQNFLGITDQNYDLAYNQEKLASAGIQLFPFQGPDVVSVINKFCPQKRLGKVYKSEIERIRNVTTYIFSNVTNIQLDPNTGLVKHLDVATNNGRSHKFSAKVFILATGGIENPRLLLSSNSVATAGIGNQMDLVGRYFMDHPRIRTNLIDLDKQVAYRRIYDATVATAKQYLGNNVGGVAAHIALSDSAQRQYHMPNSRTYLKALYYPKMTEFDTHKRDLKQAIKWGLKYNYPMATVLENMGRAAPAMLRVAPEAIAGFVDAQLNFGFLKQRFELESVFEPVPNPDSRVQLTDQIDRLGQRKAVVNWKLTDQDLKNFEYVTDRVVTELEDVGAIKRLDNPVDKIDYANLSVEGCYHHMGTTRMGASPATGVVDSDCRVFGCDNLYVAGSSVAPTVGSDMPTITLVALAIRLSAHLEKSLTRPLEAATATP